MVVRIFALHWQMPGDVEPPIPDVLFSRHGGIQREFSTSHTSDHPWLRQC